MKIKVTKDLCEIKENEIWNVGDYNVHTVQVELSPEFNGLVNKVRYFVEDNSYDMLITDNVAQVPYEATVMEGTIKIGVYGYDADTDILVQSTSPVNKYITSGTYTGDPDNTQPLTPTDKEQMESAIQKNTNDITDLKANKQDKLISGVNIKTINNESILSSGNLTLVTEETDPIFTNSPAYSITDNDITYWNNKANMSDIPDVSNFITKDVDDLTYYTKSTDMQTAINNAVDTERTARENADNSLQNQIDAITVSSDVVDVVSTYQDLVDYDTQHIKANDIIKVMQDSTHDNAISYYRWVIVNHVGSWEYVGSEGPYYTKSETDALLNIKQNTITTTNKLQSDLVDDTNQTNLFVTSTEKTTWNNKLDQSDLTDYVKNTDYATNNKGGVFKTSTYYATKNASDGTLYCVSNDYSTYQSRDNNQFISKGTLENVITGKNLETANNKVTSISSSSTDVQYPSAKCVYDNDVIIKDDVNTKYDYLFSLTNLFGKITGSGTSVTLNDTSNTIMRLNLDTTTSSQNTPTGKNLYDYTDLSSQYSFLTYDGDGWYTAVCDRTDSATERYFNFSTKASNLLETDTTYTIVTEIKSFTTTGNGGNIHTADRYGQFVTSTAGIDTVGTHVQTDTTKSSFTGITDMLIGNIYVRANSKVTAVFRISVIKGTDVTVDNFVYEPYTGGQPAPSPSYPQTVHNITGNNDIKINNKNLLKITTFSDDTTTKTTNGITATIKDGKIHISGTSSARTTFTLKKNDFTVSNEFYYYCNSINSVTRLEMQCKVDGATKYLNSYSTGNFQNATTSFEYTSLYVVVENGQTVNHTFTPMVAEGNAVSQYEPYKQQTYSVNLGDIELCKIGDYQDILFKNTINSEYYNSSLELNKWYKINNIGKLVLDGNENYDRYSSLDTANYNCFYLTRNDFFVDSTGAINTTISNYFLGQSFNDRSNNIANMWVNKFASQLYFKVPNTITTSSELKTWLNTHNTIVYYVLATPTYTLLNDTLQTQLDNLQYALAYDTQTNISQTNNDLGFTIDAETFAKIGG